MVRRMGQGKEQRAKGKRSVPAGSDIFLKIFLRSSSQSLRFHLFGQGAWRLWQHERSLLAREREEWILGRQLAASVAVICGNHRFFWVKIKASRGLSFKVTSSKGGWGFRNRLNFFVKNFDDWCSKTSIETLVICDLYAQEAFSLCLGISS